MTPVVEEWRTVKLASWLEVSDEGRIRTIPRTGMTQRGPRSYPGRILRLVEPPGHYTRLRSTFEGVEAEIRVHVEVAAAFLGPRPEGHYVCHADGDKRNNRVGNLRYDTPSANNYDEVQAGRHHYSSRTHCKHGHEFTPGNTVQKPGHSGRLCLTCRRASRLRYYYNRKVRSA